MARIGGIAIGIALVATPVFAQDTHQLCSERPGLTVNECTIEGGHAQIETSFADWTQERRDGDRTDTLLAGDTLLRVGAGGGLEVRLGWTAYGHVSDRQDGMTDRTSSVGDVTVGLKQTLIDAQAHGDRGLSLAVIPYAMLPVGREPVGAGTWSVGAQVPVGYRFSKMLKVELTSFASAAADDDGRGRHARYGTAGGVKVDVTDTVSVQAETELLRDDDPDRTKRGTQAIAGLSMGVQPDDRMQFDAGTNIGLDHAAPDIEAYVGMTRWF